MERYFRLLLEVISLNIFLKVGRWIEKKFPDKIIASEVFDKINTVHDVINAELEVMNNDIKVLTEELKKIKEDLNILKNQVTIRSKVMGSAGPQQTMTPFASRFPNGDKK